MKLAYALAYHVGKIRGNQEDNFYCDGYYRKNLEDASGALSGTASNQQFLAAVCDGMGGADLGEVASLTAVQHISPCALHDVPKKAAADLQKANAAICKMIARNNGRPMGSTATMLYIDGPSAVTCNLGDSRIYLYRNSSLEQLTTDHSRAQRLVDLGLLSPAEASMHPGKHELTQHLGIPESEMILEPTISDPLSLHPGDVFLLCSDGLTDMMNDDAIADTLASFGSAEKKAEALLKQALNAGGRDNVTILVVQVSQPWYKRLLRR
ncbi:MAG: serine/threonine-protein phosphatase [Firmicutes bacterium]|nr:serine/threonine-protein phosphatase [Bacillota bacterium]